MESARLMDVRGPIKRLFPIGLLLAVTLAVLLSAAVAQAQESDSSSGSGQSRGYDEAEAQSIDRKLMCPVCPAETIDQAQVELARQMRRLVREMLAQGASRDEVLDFFARTYGPEILAAPPKSGFNLIAWVLPTAAVVAALAAGLLVIRSMAASGAAALEDGPGAEESLQPYLEAVDRDLGLQEDPSVAEIRDHPGEEGLRRNG